MRALHPGPQEQPPNAEARLQAVGSTCGSPAGMHQHLSRRSTAMASLDLALGNCSDSLAGSLSDLSVRTLCLSDEKLLADRRPVFDELLFDAVLATEH